jgi:osmotically-inducible protein OsmY
MLGKKGNTMNVMYPLAIVDAAAITIQVKITLLYYHSISALHTQAETSNGVVTLEGKARNAAEKDLITQLVSDVHGVRRVQNKMAIEEASNL